jgi:hypothetical protein
MGFTGSTYGDSSQQSQQNISQFSLTYDSASVITYDVGVSGSVWLQTKGATSSWVVGDQFSISGNGSTPIAPYAHIYSVAFQGASYSDSIRNSVNLEAYQPSGNQRLGWTSGNTSQTVTSYNWQQTSKTNFLQNVGNAFGGNYYTMGPTNAKLLSTSGPTPAGEIQLLQGDFLADGGTFNQSGFGNFAGYVFSTATIPQGSTSTYGTPVTTRRGNFWDGYTYTTSQTQTTVSTSSVVNTESVKADYPVAIVFSGGNTGAVNVTSQGTVLLLSSQSNPGITWMTSSAGAIQAASATAVLGAGELAISAATGIGTSEVPLPVLISTGLLSANTSSGDIHITSQGSLTIAEASAPQGTVSISSSGDITSAPVSSVVNGFGGNGATWSRVGGAQISDDVLYLTKGSPNQATAAWLLGTVAAGSFQSSFTYQDNSSNSAGFTFVLQNASAGLQAVGSTGTGLGYAGITPSVAVAFNVDSAETVGVALLTNGTIASNPYLSTGSVSLKSKNPIHVTLAYDAAAFSLSCTLTDTVTGATWNHAFGGLLLANWLGQGDCLIGFTGSTLNSTVSSSSATQNISGFSFVSNEPVVNFQGNYGAAWSLVSNTSSQPVLSSNNTILTVTDGASSETHAAWYPVPVSTGDFSVQFIYQNSNGTGAGTSAANGLTFVLQNSAAGINALGQSGSGLGVAGIQPNVAYQINLSTSQGGSQVGSQFVTNGTTGNYHATGSVNFASGHQILVQLTYDAGQQTVTESLIDLTTFASFQNTYSAVNLAALLGSNGTPATTALMGFTGATGSTGATQTVSGFVFSNSLPTGAVSARTAAAEYSQPVSATMTVGPTMPVHHGIVGQQISLNSRNGQIGTPTQALRVHAGQVLFQHGVSLQAQGLVSVNQESGDLLIQSAVSKTGDVVLTALDGSILSSDSKILRDIRPLDQKQADWERLRLTGQAAVDRALRNVETLHRLYWQQYRGISTQGNTTVAGPQLGDNWTFRFTDAERQDLLARQVTASQIAQIEIGRTHQGRQLEAAFGSGSYRQDFIATLENSPSSLLKLVQWDPTALENAPAQAAFFGHRSSTVEGEPTIVGHNVKLRAAHDVGTASHPRVIQLGAGPLSAEEWLAISTAEPGTITQTGNLLTVNGENPLRIAASGEFTAEAAGSLTTSPANTSPMAVQLTNAVQSLPEKTPLTTRRFIADILIIDDSIGDNRITLSGTDAERFEVLGKSLFLREGVQLDHFERPTLLVTVTVSDRLRPEADPVAVELRLGITNVAPQVTGLTVPAGYFRAGQTILLEVTFDEPVVASGDLRIPLIVGTTQRFARYQSGSGTHTLRFAYTVAVGENDADGVQVGGAIALGSGSLQDRNGLAGEGKLPSLDTSTLRVDNTPPTLLSVTSPAAGTYPSGSQLRFTVRFSEPVTYTGTPFLLLTGIVGGVVGTAPRQAVAVSGSGTDTVVFAYTVQSGERATQVKLVRVSPRLPARIQIQVPANASVSDRAGNAPASLVTTAPQLSGVRVDAVIPQAIRVTGPAAKVYRAGSVLEFTIAWNRRVDVIGIPEFEVTIGTVTRMARYVSGSGTTLLRFRLVVEAGDSGVVSTAHQILLPEGSQIQAAGNQASLPIPPRTGRLVRVDAVIPAVTQVQLPAAATYVPGERLRVVVEFTEVVKVQGTVWIDVLLGKQVRRFVCTAGCGSRRLTFTYRVSALDPELDGLQLPAQIGLVRGRITDLAGNLANLELPASEETGVLIRRRN